MQALAAIAEAVGGTTKKNEKTRLLAEYFRSRPLEEAAVSALLLSGRAFPAWEETTLNVGGALLWRAVQRISGASDAELGAAYQKFGDLGLAAAEVLSKAARSEERRVGTEGGSRGGAEADVKP